VDKFDTSKDPATEVNELSLPLPGPVVLGPTQTNRVGGGAITCLACGLGGPVTVSVSGGGWFF
jgi:hypothetical protein